MDATPGPVGVAVAAPGPAPSWPKETQWVPPNPPRPLTLPSPPAPAWPRSAQVAMAALLVLALGLLAWHAYTLQRWGTRPTTLEPDALQKERLDLNRADRVQLLQLPGVGERLAGQIEAYRREHGRFRSVEELRRVKGVGVATLEVLRPLVRVEPLAAEEEAEVVDVAPPRPLQQKRAPAVRKNKKALPERPINVNTATAAELQRLPGIGPAFAARIIEARTVRPFRSVDELRRIKGIKTKRLEALRPFATVGPAGIAVAHDK